MGKPNGKAALVALSLRREIERAGYSVRGFGKAVDPDDPERGRRRLQRHLSGRFLPSRASRIAYAIALGLPEEFFLDADDEEDVQAPLARAIQRAVRDALREGVRA